MCPTHITQVVTDEDPLALEKRYRLARRNWYDHGLEEMSLEIMQYREISKEQFDDFGKPSRQQFQHFVDGHRYGLMDAGYGFLIDKFTKNNVQPI